MPSLPPASGSRLVNALHNALVPVWASVVPESVAEVRDAVLRSNGRLSVSGQRYSPDTQFALADSLHVDLGQLNRVVSFEPLESSVRVQAGIRWSELLRFIQPHGFALAVPPMFINASVGGSVSANAWGQGSGAGPVGNAVLALRVVLADGRIVETSPEHEPELFAALIGGFGGLGIIVEVSLALSPNGLMLRRASRMPTAEYADFYRARIAPDPGAVLHRAEFDLPRLRRVHVTTWVGCELRASNEQPLRIAAPDEPLGSLLGRRGRRNPLTRWWRVHVSDPIRDSRRIVHWRNFEASADITRSFPKIHDTPPHECLDFAIPPARMSTWLERLAAVLREFHVDASGLSAVQMAPTRNSLLPLNDEDAIVFRLIVRSAAIEGPQRDQSTWVRALIDAAIDCGGRFGLAQRMHATQQQFLRAYPRARQLLEVKRRVDPHDRFGNGFWTRYLEPAAQAASGDTVAGDVPVSTSEVRTTLADPESRDVVHRMVHECAPARRGGQVFSLLQRLAARTGEDELIYRNLRRTLQKWSTAPLASLMFGPAEWRQALQRRIAPLVRERLELIAGFDRQGLDGVLDCDGSGGQLNLLRRSLTLTGHVGTVGGLGIPGSATAGAVPTSRVPARRTANAADWSRRTLGVPPASLALMLLLGGLNGLADDDVEALLGQVREALRPGGLVLLLEHDADGPQTALQASMGLFVAHLCSGQSWEALCAHPRNFHSRDEWRERFARHGLRLAATPDRLARSAGGDTLFAFVREG